METSVDPGRCFIRLAELARLLHWDCRSEPQLWILATPMPLSRHPVPRHRLTLDEYHRLGEAGILGEDDRVELLEGQLADMSPIGPWHALAVDTLIELLVTRDCRARRRKGAASDRAGRRDGTAAGHQSWSSGDLGADT